LTGILALAGILRLYALPSRGFIYWDEGTYALEGVRLHAYLESLAGVRTSLAAGMAVNSARPTHALLIALAYFVAGFHDYTSLVMDALLSTATVAVTYAAARRLFDARVALLSALFLAASEYDIIYARSALAESDGTFLLLLGFLCWVLSLRREDGAEDPPARPRPRTLIAAGLLFGLAFTVNFRLIVYIAGILVVEACWSWQKEGLRYAVQRLLLISAGLIVFPSLWEIVGVGSRAAGHILFQNIFLGPTTYWQEAVYNLHQGKASRFLPSPGLYLQWFVTRQAWPYSVLVAVGLALTAWRRSLPWLAVAAPPLVAYVTFALGPYPWPRNISSVFPYTSVLAAAALITVVDRLKTQRAVTLLLVLLVAALVSGSGAVRSWPLTSIRSGFARMAVPLDRRSRPLLLTSTEIMVWYQRGSSARCSVVGLPRSLAGLSAYVHAGYRYAVTEAHHTHPVVWYIRDHAIRVKHYSALSVFPDGEDLISTENGDPPGPASNREYVELYRLDRLHLPAPNRRSLHACVPNSIV
jgi:4-amino-4-deoxy-L-arabinose transferase-like glycosyltransferase